MRIFTGKINTLDFFAKIILILVDIYMKKKKYLKQILRNKIKKFEVNVHDYKKSLK